MGSNSPPPATTPESDPTSRSHRGRANVADRVYSEILRRIVDGRYRLNQPLVETDLAVELSSSRTPIRQGLQRLELEGLVVASKSGWAVREHTVGDVLEVYDIRLPLEGYAARLATVRARDAELKQILELKAELDQHLGHDDRDAYVRFHDALHDAIFQAAGNDLLHGAVRQYRSHPYNRRVAHLYSDAEIQAVSLSHEQLAVAIASRDADAAEQCAREHLELSRQVTIDRLMRLG